MGTAAVAGVLYFIGVFAVGVVLGSVRMLTFEPMFGATTAVALELPIMIGVSWLSCRALIDWCAVEHRRASRLVMGGVALVLMLLAEAALSTVVLGRSMSEHIAFHTTTSGLLGLAGQVLMAVFPSAELMADREDRPIAKSAGDAGRRLV